MDSNQTHLVDEQAELLTGLLDQEEPGTYVFITPSALTTQLLIALRETVDREGRVRPGKASARLMRSLAVLGFVVNSRNLPPGTNLPSLEDQ